MAEKNTSKKTAASSSSKSKNKKLTVTLDAKTFALFEEYLTEHGYSKDTFVKQAITEKISRDKISHMIDDMIQL